MRTAQALGRVVHSPEMRSVHEPLLATLLHMPKEMQSHVLLLFFLFFFLSVLLLGLLLKKKRKR